jgi:hypothetical protein
MEKGDGKMEKGSVKTYNWVIGLLQKLDFADSARRMGLRLVSHSEIEINFLGSVYSIFRDASNGGAVNMKLKSETVASADKGLEYEYNIKSVLGYYALSESDVVPANDYCLLTNFSHGVFKTDSSDWAAPLTKVFGNDYDKFRSVALKLGMTDEGVQGGGKRWHYELLPKMPIKLVYYEGDDEFPSAVRILFDKTAIEIYKFEPLAVLNSCLVHALAAIGKAL